jgi:aspartyl-tRNA(Asn)/glutamyl-tRNA(Gln) amidotransferase subunit A
MQANDLCYLSARELVDLYRSGEVSPVEVTEAVLARIEQYNPSLNAFITVTAERAMQDARKSESRYRDSTAGPLEGVPTSIKDLVPTAGIRTTNGSLLHKDRVPTEDAPLVERLYAAGIVMLGKTNTPENGWKGDSGNRIIGPTHNPWKHGRTAGGSSGGAAAAVVAGMGALAQGGDGAGSIRIPASFSGCYGLKPSFGLVPHPTSSAMLTAHAGPMTRTVRDAAMMLNVLAGPDERDRYTFPTTTDFLEGLDGGIRGLRVAWSPDLGYAPVEPEVHALTEAAAMSFKDLGCEVVEAHPDAADTFDITDTLWIASQASGHIDNLDEVRDLIDPGRLELIERGRHLSGAEVAKANIKRLEFYETMRLFMQDYDLMLTPALSVPAFKAGDDFPETVNGQPTTYLGWTGFSYPFNLTGQPAASIPAGFTSEGLPVGLQIVGRWRDDLSVLRASAAFEEMSPWQQYRPTLD